MGKSTHFTRQLVYNQVIKLLDKQKIKQISLETPEVKLMLSVLTGCRVNQQVQNYNILL